jgi:hypothetical protein
MIGLQIEDTKLFMNNLFKETSFDNFETVSVNLKTIVTYEIDGLINKAYLEEAPTEGVLVPIYLTWEAHKQHVFQLIKGGRSPLFFKIIFTLSSASTKSILEKLNMDDQLVQGFFINITYDHPTLKLTTGTNYKTFTMDKSIEQYFDQSIQKFMNKHNITYALA